MKETARGSCDRYLSQCRGTRRRSAALVPCGIPWALRPRLYAPRSAGCFSARSGLIISRSRRITLALSGCYSPARGLEPVTSSTALRFDCESAVQVVWMTPAFFAAAVYYGAFSSRRDNLSSCLSHRGGGGLRDLFVPARPQPAPLQIDSEVFSRTDRSSQHNSPSMHFPIRVYCRASRKPQSPPAPRRDSRHAAMHFSSDRAANNLPAAECRQISRVAAASQTTTLSR